MLDKASLEALGAKVTKVSVEYSRKVWSDDMGSLGGSIAVEADITGDPDAAANALWEWGKAAVSRNLKATYETLRPNVEREDKPPQPEPERAPAEESEMDTETIVIETISVEYGKSGAKLAKVKGGNYKKFGVTAWPEPFEAIGFKLEKLDAGDHAPAKFGITKAVVLMKEKGGKRGPDKVWRFIK